jgi:hypothetical protein
MVRESFICANPLLTNLLKTSFQTTAFVGRLIIDFLQYNDMTDIRQSYRFVGNEAPIRLDLASAAQHQLKRPNQDSAVSQASTITAWQAPVSRGLCSGLDSRTSASNFRQAACNFSASIWLAVQAPRILLC